jgi:hypothetical protein
MEEFKMKLKTKNCAELTERIYHFGNNTTMSNIWPMFSAEDSLDTLDATIYLGDWLQGTEYWAPQQHYLTEAQNIFRDQVSSYVDSTQLITSWNKSIKIDGYSFFKYGLAPLDTIRIQDRTPNIYSNYDCFSARYASGNLQNIIEDTINFAALTTYIKLDEIYFVYTYLGQEFGKLNHTQILALPKGSYILKNEKNSARIIFNNF